MRWELARLTSIHSCFPPSPPHLASLPHLFLPHIPYICKSAKDQSSYYRLSIRRKPKPSKLPEKSERGDSDVYGASQTCILFRQLTEQKCPPVGNKRPVPCVFPSLLQAEKADCPLKSEIQAPICPEWEEKHSCLHWSRQPHPDVVSTSDTCMPDLPCALLKGPQKSS